MIDPGWLASAGPILLGAGVGLAVRRVLSKPRESALTQPKMSARTREHAR